MRRKLMLIATPLACLMLVAPTFHRGRPQIVSTAHAQEGCSVASLRGAYGIIRNGTTAVGPLGAIGIATFDGVGSSSNIQTIRKNGATTSDLFSDPPLVAPYEIDPNCAGKFLNPDGSAFAHVVVVDGGKRAFIISLSSGNTVTGALEKISTDQ